MRAMSGLVAGEPFPSGLRVGRAALIALPFLSPLVAGPSANAWQWFVTWLCAAVATRWLAIMVLNDGTASAARIATSATTTIASMSVKPSTR